MRKVLAFVLPILLAYLLLTFFSGSLLGLQGGKLWILRAALWLIGITAATVVIWFFWDKQKKEKKAEAETEEAPSGGDEIAVLMRDAERKLAAAQLAKGARIGNLPAILLLGEPSSTKTSTVVHSGLEPELLAGQVYQDGNITSTRSANLWYSHQTIFVEAGGKLLEDEQARTYLAKHLQPRKLGAVVGGGGQAPRAALVCVEVERITAGGQAMAATARNLRARLGEIAQSFGIQLPVYVLFTKTDRLSFFADFVRNLSNEEAAQPLGVTVPIPGAPSGVWAEEQTARLGANFDQIFRALANARPELLARENDAEKLPGAYEFPREFKKLRGSLVQFLVDLCRPSQLTVGPFLRGFYFSGVRPIIVQEAAPAAEVRAPEAQGKSDAREATAMFRVPSGGQAPAAPRQRMAVSRKVPQWLFLTHFFNHVLLADRAAMGASGSSAKADTLRRILLISAAVLCLVFCVGFTVSFFLNRGLEGQVHEALQGTTVAPAASLASVDSLRRLESLRQSLDTLTVYNREGAPLRYRWGLYAGNDMYPEVRRLYFTRFKALLFGQTQINMVSFLSGLPAAPGPATPAYDEAYNTLKAYLITTSNHDKCLREFLSPVLMKTWRAGATVDPERLQLAQKQFDFYSDELKVENPFTKQNDQAAVLRARSYLKQFGDLDRIYQAMKSGAPKTTINFNRQFVGSKEYVLGNYDVPGPFTKDGWKFMSAAIQRPDSYVHGETWVLGDQGSGNADPGQLSKPLLSRYEADYIKEWRNYLRSASVNKYRDIKDASEKLNVLAGGQSHLLALFALASENIAWDDPVIAKELQPLQYLEPPGSGRYVNPANKDYIGALSKLQTDIAAVADSPAGGESPAANQALSDARDAKNITNQLAALNFNPDPERLVQNLLLEPITNAEAKLKGLGPDELNAGGKALCGQFRAVLNKYPFNSASSQDASVAELNSILRKPDGALWKFYDDNLKKFLPKQGDQYVPAPGNVTLNPRFVEFFKQAAGFSDFLYSGGTVQDPHFSYSLKPVLTEGVTRVGLEIDGQKLDFFGGIPTAKQFTWQPAGVHAAKGTYTAEGASFSDNGGLWAVFRLFGEADKSTPAAGGNEYFDWIIRTGAAGKPSMLPSGNKLTVRLELDTPAAAPMFRKGFFNRLACVSEVAKP